MNNKKTVRNKKTQKRTTRKKNGMTWYMKRKILFLCTIIFLVALFLVGRLIYITATSEEKYKKQILSQQNYDSVTIPYERGSILDANGIVLASSQQVYNVILDTSVLLYNDDYNEEPMLEAIETCFDVDMDAVVEHVEQNKVKKQLAEESGTTANLSAYYRICKEVTYEQKVAYEEYVENANTQLKAECEENGTSYPGNLYQGIWFESYYVRDYPYDGLASEVLGFTGSDNNGMFGLEEYYNDVLNGTAGREFGYLDGDNEVQTTVIPATDGNSVVTNIDYTIQGIVEKYIDAYNEELRDNAREGAGAEDIGVIVMDIDTGGILAMATNTGYDNNNPYDLTDYYSEAELTTISEDETSYSDALNQMWRSFCLSDTYEPGSVSKPFTVAMALETGTITGNEVYTCTGGVHVGDYYIQCHNIYGDGEVTVSLSIQESCNVVMMYMAQALGIENFVNYQNIFGFGLKSNVDLAGEARTASLIHTIDTMGATELATDSFGQGFQTSMIQMIASFSSLVNGGYLYEPQVVKQVLNSSGTVVETIEPKLVKQTISETTSDKLISYLNATVVDGTGTKSRPAGYLTGGKTGTSETLPRGNNEYVVSFMGYAPADDPQIAVYAVINKPNVVDQSLGTEYACWLVRDIFTEVLPYMNIYMTEELSDAEQIEMQARESGEVYSFDVPTTLVVSEDTTTEDTEDESTASEDIVE
ncbi:MAG: penicillin-binding transpeptidase domain-containing protein [Lachnospiraceae bacterium]